MINSKAAAVNSFSEIFIKKFEKLIVLFEPSKQSKATI